jgi:hypothetical protein
MKTPVAFLIFKRPDTTEKVFEAIRQAKPPKLLVVADGPRPDRPGEAEKCQATREIIKRVDWDCEVLTNYSDVNLGCKKRVSSGLDWVFENVEEAIILEDDCLPHSDFFRFCEELLEYYRYDRRIMAICGFNCILNSNRSKDSYYFSRDFFPWGWASWKRSWQYYDCEMKHWTRIRDEGWLKDILQNNKQVAYWKEIFQNTYQNHINTWDYQWIFSCWIQSGLTILPNANLISNIGFGKDATHTIEESRLSNVTSLPINFPIEHPQFIIKDIKADNFRQNHIFSVTRLNTLKIIFKNIKNKLLKHKLINQK